MELKKSLFGYNVQSVTELLNTKENYYLNEISAKDLIIEEKESEIAKLLEKISVMDQQQNEMLAAFKEANEKIKNIELKAKTEAERIVAEAEKKQQEMYDLLTSFRDSLINVETAALDTVEKFLYGIKELERSVPSKDKILNGAEVEVDKVSKYTDAKDLMHAIYEISGRSLAVNEE